LLDLSRQDGSESLHLAGWRRCLRALPSENPLGNLRKMSIQEVTTLAEIIVCFAQNGKAAHALHIDCKTNLGPWMTFASGETLDRALICLGATDEQMETHRESMRSWGQGSTHIRLLPNRKNLLRIYYSNL
jgi:hypothetical protein